MVKVAMCQARPKLGDIEFNLHTIEKSISIAKSRGADLIIFPELMLTGYSVKPILKDVYQTLNGAYLNQIKDWCMKHNIYSIVSFLEKKDNAYFISAMLIDSGGNTIGIYRKTHLFDNEKEYITAGESLNVFKTDLGNIGIMICYDLEFPEVARILALKGADYILVPTANMSPYEHHQEIYAQSRALENEVPIIVCNRTGEEEGIHFFGESIVVDAKGKMVKVEADKELIRIVEVEKDFFDDKLHYLCNREPQKYRKLIDEMRVKSG